MVFKRRTSHHPTIIVDANILECVPRFVYLGNLVTTINDCSAEINERINLASQRMGMQKTFWSRSKMTIRMKMHIFVSCVFSLLLSSAEAQTIDTTNSRILLAFEIRCYRRLPKEPVYWKDKVSNVIIRCHSSSAPSTVPVLFDRQWHFSTTCRHCSNPQPAQLPLCRPQHPPQGPWRLRQC